MKPDLRHLDPASRRWRAWLLTICGIAIIIQLLSNLECSPLMPRCGTAGFSPEMNFSTGWAKVTSVESEGPADRAGIRPRDRIDTFGDTNFSERWLLRSIRESDPIPPYRVITYVIHRDGHKFTAFINPQSLSTDWATWFEWLTWPSFVAGVGQLWLMAFALFLAVRRPDLEQARVLSLYLVVSLLARNFDGSLPWWPRIDFFLTLVASASPLLLVLLLVLFTSTFARPLSPWRRRLSFLAVGLAIVAQIVHIASFVNFYWMARPTSWFGAVDNLIGIPILLGLACAIAATAASNGAERQRAAWVTLSVAPWCLGTSAFLLLVQVNQHDGFLNQEWLDAWNGSLAVLQFIMPVGLTYAVLSRRIIDTGYVINRTAVFAGISIVVLGAFVLVEWALGTWVGNISRTTSIIVNVIVALALGLSIRPIHRRVEKVIDQLFFRRRHEDEAALRTFADEATFITDSNVLLDRTIEQVKKYGDLDRVAILVQNGAGTYERARGDGVQVVSENDPAILAMRASHKPADLQRYDTVVDGDRAFPMLSKGRMLGVLVCGSKSTKEPYAPDEADALAAVAHGVGFALDSLSTTPTDGRVVALLEQILAKLDGSPRSSS